MTLSEFITDVGQRHNIPVDPKKLQEQIEELVRLQKPEDETIVAVSDQDIEKWIVEGTIEDTINRIKKEQEEKDAKERAEREAKKAKEKEEKKAQKAKEKAEKKAKEKAEKLAQEEAAKEVAESIEEPVKKEDETPHYEQTNLF